MVQKSRLINQLLKLRRSIRCIYNSQKSRHPIDENLCLFTQLSFLDSCDKSYKNSCSLIHPPSCSPIAKLKTSCHGIAHFFSCLSFVRISQVQLKQKLLPGTQVYNVINDQLPHSFITFPLVNLLIIHLLIFQLLNRKNYINKLLLTTYIYNFNGAHLYCDVQIMQ